MASGPESALSPHDPRCGMPADRSGPNRPPMPREQQFLAELPVIERVVSWVCARRSLRGADADDFRQAVMFRIVEADYDVLAKFQGRSSLKTYLTAVINRMYLDFQVQRFGKWRPSAEARRLGPAALRLECLIYRDGLSFDEACGVLLSDPRVGETRDALHSISQRIPVRVPRGRIDSLAAGARDDDSTGVERAERQTLAERTLAVIRRVLSRLPPRDRLLFRLLFESGFTVADAARSLHLDQKALYRKRDSVLAHLRQELGRAGIGADDVHELVTTLDWDVALDLEPRGLQSPEQPGAAAPATRPWPRRCASRWTKTTRRFSQEAP